MRSILPVVSLLLGFAGNSPCHAQEIYQFDYDANGSRTSRTIILAEKSAIQKDSVDARLYNEVIDELEISFYPNPTEGEINILFRNLPENESASVFLYDFNGHLVQSYSNIRDNKTVDLSGLPGATYFFRIVAGNKKTEWKVIKE